MIYGRSGVLVMTLGASLWVYAAALAPAPSASGGDLNGGSGSEARVALAGAVSQEPAMLLPRSVPVRSSPYCVFQVLVGVVKAAASPALTHRTGGGSGPAP